jgi:hypothetical protein
MDSFAQTSHTALVITGGADSHVVYANAMSRACLEPVHDLPMHRAEHSSAQRKEA